MSLFSKEQTPGKPEARPAATPSPSGGATIIGGNIVLEGTLTGSEPIVIEGTVRGKIDVTSDLRVGMKANVEATVHARNVVVEGRVVGDVSADSRVELVPSAQMDGNIKAPKIVVAEGAKFRGSVDMGSPRPRQTGAEAKSGGQ
jgi:cytoskeletal protein CcmA (bactofilin family)